MAATKNLVAIAILIHTLCERKSDENFPYNEQKSFFRVINQ